MHAETLRFRRHAPHPTLTPYVQSYWEMASAQRLPAGAEEVRYLHPDGGDGIFFNFGEPVRTDGEPRPTGFVAGSRLLAPTTIYFEGEVRTAGVRFRPGGVYAFFRRAGLDEGTCAPRELEALYERVGEARGHTGWTRVLDSWLLERLGDGALSPAAEAATRAIVSQAGALPAEGVANRLGLSLRHLERLFREQVGYSPKQLARIVRARRAKRSLAALPEAPLIELAYDFGYADQAHFTREFRSIIGITPAAYRSCIRRRMGADDPASIGADRKSSDRRIEASAAALSGPA